MNTIPMQLRNANDEKQMCEIWRVCYILCFEYFFDSNK